MIYLDSSVALAHLLTEQTRPSERFWLGPIVSSRLLDYEVWNRLHARALGPPTASRRTGCLSVELTPAVLRRALEPFPLPVRTLDGLHLATMEFLRAEDRPVELASYDTRLLTGARAVGIAPWPL